MPSKAFFHMSSTLYEVGNLVSGNGRDKVDPRIEEAMEARRPAGRLSRRDAVFVRPIADFERCGLTKPGYVYEIGTTVEPDVYDLAWTGEIEKSLLKQKYDYEYLRTYPDWGNELLDRCCGAYWRGEATVQPIWEGLVPSVKVVKILTKTPVTVEQTRGGLPAAEGGTNDGEETSK
jgi:hypothetical protein